ncbi:tetratricopeptide repeat protein [Terracidiphilus sp.]|jgi:tetratricopeptide (TPR) repeat protein|uniref:tetratricopeptide repeat protein n=1 Tax=Terracidiphilus sp. TaxID=1964191 RepID=UPI003C15C4FE
MMMISQHRLPLLGLALFVSVPAAMLAQAPAPAQPPVPPAAQAPNQPNALPDPHADARSQAYFHAAMAGMYEDEAMNTGRPEYVQHAVEEYKAAINADPSSPQLYNGLADLYFRTGRAHDAETTARQVLKTDANNIDALKLLGRVYLRQLSEDQNAGSAAQAQPNSNVADQAIATYEKLVELQPRSVEQRMVLGQLYLMKHQQAKAEQQFQTARSIEPESEEVILNLARVYAENNDLAQTAKIIEAVPEADRTPRMEFTLGATYDQLKRPKDAIAAYKRANDMQPGDPQTLNALGQALLNDNQLEDALKQYKNLTDANPDDADSLVRIADIERRQGKYEDALAAARKAVSKEPDNLEAGYNEGLLLDVLGRYDESAAIFEKMLEQPTINLSHANGAYTDSEKNNRSIFLDRLASVYHEQGKVDQAAATYQKMIDLGGDNAIRGYQGQIDAYRESRVYDKAVDAARAAVTANPKNRDLKLALADVLVDASKGDEAITTAKSLLNNSPDDRGVWLEITQIDIRLKRWKDAEDAVDKADALATKKEERINVLFLKGELADRQKHMEQAEGFFKQVLDLDPNNALTLNYLGYMLADKGVRLPEAVKYIRKAVELDPTNGAFLDSLGWAYLKLGEYELSEEKLRQAVDRSQSDPTVHDHLGDLYEKTGRIRLAAAQWELSLAGYARSSAVDIEPGDVAKVQKKLDGAHVKLARQDNSSGTDKP